MSSTRDSISFLYHSAPSCFPSFVCQRGSLRSSFLFFFPCASNTRTSSDMSELTHQLRSQFGLHQPPRMSLFACRCSQLYWRSLDDTPREFNPAVASHRAHAYSRSPSMMCSFSRDSSWNNTASCPGLLSSCARLQPCFPEGKSALLAVWCPVLSSHSVCPNEASTSFLRLSEPSPPVWRLCRAASNCSQSDPHCRSGGSLGFLDCDSCIGETPETDNRLFLASCSAWRHSLHSYSVCG